MTSQGWMDSFDLANGAADRKIETADVRRRLTRQLLCEQGLATLVEFVDLTLQPLETQKEQFLMHFDTDVEEVEIEANLSYYVSGKKGDVIYSVKETLAFELE